MLCPRAGEAAPPDGTLLTKPRGWCTTGSRRIRCCMSGSNQRPRSGEGGGFALSTTVRWPRSCAGWDSTHGWCTQPGFASMTTRSGLWATRGSGSDSTATCATCAHVRPAIGPGLPALPASVGCVASARWPASPRARARPSLPSRPCSQRSFGAKAGHAGLSTPAPTTDRVHRPRIPAIAAFGSSEEPQLCPRP
jgi:hypothetical protein